LSEDTTARLETLEDHAIKTEGRLTVIESTQRSHGDKLDRIVEAVTTYGARPVFNLSGAISMVRDIFAIASVIGGLAVWFVLTMTAANDRISQIEIAHMRERVATLEKSFSWKPIMESSR
jgi:hypothetical protein